MIKMFINDEEVVSNKELVIKEEMLATPSAILNNCYPKTWEDIKDYTSKFYYPRDYSRCIIGQGSFEHGTNRYAKLNISGIFSTFETNIEKPFDKIQIDGKSTQATSTNPVMPSPDNPSEIECVRGKNLIPNNWKLIDANYTKEYGKLTVSGKLSTSYLYGGSTNFIGLTLKAGTYTFSASSDTFVNIYAVVNSNGTIENWSNGITKTFTSDVVVQSIRCNEVTVSTGTYLWIAQIEKGAVATSYLPYDIIQVKDVGKNLFNPNTVLTGYFIDDRNGNATANGGSIASDYIEIKPNTNYYITKIPSGNWGAWYDENKNYISGILGYQSQLSPSNAKYMRLTVSYTQNNLEYANSFMVSKGSVSIPFEPYQEKILNIDLQGNELCSLPNGVKDELVVENGRAKIIKRVSKYNITGNEAWALSSTESQPYINFSNYINDCKYPATTTELPNLLSNYYLQIARNNLYDGRITLSPGKALIIYDTIHNTSLANFKTWLKSANVVVYYELATPTEIDLGEVDTLSTFKGVNNVSLDANMQTNMNLTYLWENYKLLFCGIVKNSGNISLNPRYPHFGSFQILDFKTFLSESDTLDFVISNKTITEAIEMVIDAISTYGFILGNIKIFGADDVIGAYSTQNKTAYDVFQYIAEITGSRWFTRLIDEKTIAIDFYDPTLMERGDNLEYNEKYFEDNYVVDLSFSYGSRDYRNKQVILSDEIYASIDYTEVILSNGYQTTFNTENNIGIIKSIYIDNTEKTFATNNEKETGIDAEFYYTPGKSSFESDGSTYPAGTQITITYTPLVRGRQVVYNNDEVARIYAQTGRKGVIARYESRNDILSSKELDKVGQSYIKYKGSPEVILTLTTEEKDLYNIGQIVYFDSPIPELAQDYMIKSKQIKIIMIDEISQKVFFIYELTSSFNAEKEINYFDNQRNKNKGNISVGETITRNIDIENTANIIFKDMTINEASATGNNLLNSVLNSPFVE